MEVRAIPRTVSMYPEQWQKVEGLASEGFGGNVSLTLRHMVDAFPKVGDGMGDVVGGYVLGQVMAEEAMEAIASRAGDGPRQGI